MISRTAAFLSAVVLLGVVRGAIWRAESRGKPFFVAKSDLVPDRSAGRLFFASALTLFGELAFIRWISVEVRVFAYFKNLALLLCFLGFGLGCALVKQQRRWASAVSAFLGLLLIVRIPWQSARLLEGLSQALGGAEDIGIWQTPASTDWPFFLAAAALATCLFVLIVLLFVPLGQIVSKEMDRAANPLRAYSWNLIGSVAGTVVFLIVSRLMLPPTIWMAGMLIGFACLQESREDAVLVMTLLVPVILLLHEPVQPDRQVFWTPYQQVEYERRYTPQGELWGGEMLVNHTLYQRIVNLSREFIARHDEIRDELIHNPYNLPFRFAVRGPSVLVVGSGTGNDVAAALRHDSRWVDAVEIDPAIFALGKREHPEHPYDSPRVGIHLDDARNFLERTAEHYDLILFGLLDSHSQFSNYSNMRIDNFVYTQEAFRKAYDHLSSDGIIFVKFQVDRPWLGTRLAEILRTVFGKSPLVFTAASSYSTEATCFVVSRSHRIDEALAADPELASFVSKNVTAGDGQSVPITTDDWPYLYQKDRGIPRTYFSISMLVLAIAIGSYLKVGKSARTATSSFSLFFFSMGAGFMLLETQIVSRLALYFGTVWQVNGIVVTSLLLALLLANLAVERMKSLRTVWVWIGLLSSLAAAYWFPFARIGGAPETIGMIAVVLFSVPVLLAGILFSSEFRNTASPSAALNSNIMGAVVGGLMENSSLLFGLRALLLIAIGLYCLAGLALWQRKRRSVGTNSSHVCRLC